MEQSLYGKVWIAGAGPGDAGLLTLRTAELIEEADVIVYDALLSAEILSRIPRETETIYVGKHAGKPSGSSRRDQSDSRKRSKKREKSIASQRRRSIRVRKRRRRNRDT